MVVRRIQKVNMFRFEWQKFTLLLSSGEIAKIVRGLDDEDGGEGDE